MDYRLIERFHLSLQIINKHNEMRRAAASNYHFDCLIHSLEF